MPERHWQGMMARGMMAFEAQTAEALLRDGWRIARAPAGVTLAGLRAEGAPFKGSKYFDVQAGQTLELPVAETELAYRPGLQPGTASQPFEACERLVTRLEGALPPRVVARIAPAALYVWTLWMHRRTEGEWPLSGCYTWAADRSGTARLAVGIFGRERPIVVSPIPEGSGRGIGVMPIVFPGATGP
jgi:hypothetical protein